jgi:hypothetical protein
VLGRLGQRSGMSPEPDPCPRLRDNDERSIAHAPRRQPISCEFKRLNASGLPAQIGRCRYGEQQTEDVS